MIALTRIQRHFLFLEAEYEAKPVKLKLSKWDREWLPVVLYVNATTATRVEYEVREGYANVRLYPLESGKLPADAESGLHGFPLNHIVALKNKAALLGSVYDHPQFSDPTRGIDTYLERVAENLRLYADDFLRGDFSLIPKLLPTLGSRPAR